MCLCTLCSARQAMTKPDDVFRVLLLGALVEPVVPDLRLEFDHGSRALLSWPIHLDLTRFMGRKYASGGDAVFHRYAASLFIEPQWRKADGQARLLVGTRQGFSLGGFGLVTDIAGVYGSDGSGLVVGAGPAILFPPRMQTIALVFRQTLTTEGPRSDISLDLLAFYY